MNHQSVTFRSNSVYSKLQKFSKSKVVLLAKDLANRSTDVVFLYSGALFMLREDLYNYFREVTSTPPRNRSWKTIFL